MKQNLFKTNKNTRTILKATCALLVFATLLTGCSKDGKDNESTADGRNEDTYSSAADQSQDNANNDPASSPEGNSSQWGGIIDNGGSIHGGGKDNTESDTVPGYEAQSRPEENMEIPYEETKLYRVFDYVDKYHLYIRTKQHTLSPQGYTTHVIEYAFNGLKIYLHQEVNGEHLHYYSDGKQLYGFDFEEQTYTLLAPHTYTADEILYLGNYTKCSSTGKDKFLGKELDYEDYTENDTEWIRYYFYEDESLAGYERYDTATNEIVEITSYEAFTSEFPEDAVLYFEIPAGFKEYTNIIEFPDLDNEDW